MYRISHVVRHSYSAVLHTSVCGRLSLAGRFKAALHACGSLRYWPYSASAQPYGSISTTHAPGAALVLAAVDAMESLVR